MSKKKTFTKQAKENLADAAKSYKKLDLQLKRAKKDFDHMIAHKHDGPTYRCCPPPGK
jgi:hypothetical protein